MIFIFFDCFFYFERKYEKMHEILVSSFVYFEDVRVYMISKVVVESSFKSKFFSNNGFHT